MLKWHKNLLQPINEDEENIMAKNPPETNIFDNFLSFFDGTPKASFDESKLNISIQKPPNLIDILSKNHINTLTYDKKTKKVENIERSANHLNRAKFTQDLIEFIKKDFYDEEITQKLDALPKGGSENQDRKLIEIAFELHDAKKIEIESYYEIKQEDLTIDAELKNSLKEKIEELHKNKDNFDICDQFSRAGEDVINLSLSALSTILIVPFEICLGREEEKPPKTIIKIRQQKQNKSFHCVV
jgi:hypothetical protein